MYVVTCTTIIQMISNPKYFETGGVGACGNKDFPNIYARLEDKEILNWVKAVAGISVVDIPNVFTTAAISSTFKV